MVEWITALLERKSATSGDGPRAASCWLALRLENGRTLTVFDSRTLSDPLRTGERYTFLLSLATAYHMQRISEPELREDEENTGNVESIEENLAHLAHSRYPWRLSARQELAGIVRALRWRCPQQAHLAAHPRLYERRAVLIETPFGHLITSASLIERLIGAAPASGDALEWEGGRLALWAARP